MPSEGVKLGGMRLQTCPLVAARYELVQSPGENFCKLRQICRFNPKSNDNRSNSARGQRPTELAPRRGLGASRPVCIEVAQLSQLFHDCPLERGWRKLSDGGSEWRHVGRKSRFRICFSLARWSGAGLFYSRLDAGSFDPSQRPQGLLLGLRAGRCISAPSFAGVLNLRTSRNTLSAIAGVLKSEHLGSSTS